MVCEFYVVSRIFFSQLEIFDLANADYLKCGWTSTKNTSTKELMTLQSILEIFPRNVLKDRQCPSKYNFLFPGGLTP